MLTSRGITLAALLGAALVLGGCNGGGSSSDDVQSGNNGGSGGTGGTGGSGGSSGNVKVTGPLDPVQDALSDVLGNQIGGALPEPLGPTVQCADTALAAFTDVPDALLLAFMSLPNGADPAAAFQGASAQMVASMQDFAARLQTTLRILAGQTSVCGSSAVGGNPLAGTPLEPVGAPLVALLSALQGVGANPTPAALSAAVMPALEQLFWAFDALPPEVTGAPVVGGILDTLQIVTGRIGQLLLAGAATDPVAAQAAVEALIDDVISGVLLGVLPVSAIDAASPGGVPDIAPQIQAAIDQLTGALGGSMGSLIPAGFDSQLPDVMALFSDPTTGLMALLAGGSPSNPLDGILGTLAGGGVSPLDPLLALLTAGAGGASLDNLADSLSGGGAGSPIEDLMDVVGGGAGLDALLSLMSLLNSLPLPAPLADILETVLGLN